MVRTIQMFITLGTEVPDHTLELTTPSELAEFTFMPTNFELKSRIASMEQAYTGGGQVD